jgi:hypothetical protein
MICSQSPIILTQRLAEAFSLALSLHPRQVCKVRPIVLSHLRNPVTDQFVKGLVSLFQQSLGSLHPLLNHVLMGRNPYGLFEQTAEMKETHAEKLGQVSQFHGLGQVSIDIVQYLVEVVRGQAAFVTG